jgi:hypothetical protein
MKNRQLDRLKRTEGFRFAHGRVNRHAIHLVHRYEGYVTLQADDGAGILDLDVHAPLMLDRIRESDSLADERGHLSLDSGQTRR